MVCITMLTLVFLLKSHLECVLRGLHKATLKLLEPMMKVEVVTPEEFMGDVIGDLNSRRGQVASTDSRDATAINATVPCKYVWIYK